MCFCAIFSALQCRSSNGSPGIVHLEVALQVNHRAAVFRGRLGNQPDPVLVKFGPRVRREVSLLRRVRRVPRVPQVFFCGVAVGCGLPVMVVTFVPGPDLTGYKGLWTEWHSKLMLETLTGVHRCGIVHRDVKPDNIVVHNCTGEPWLIDFDCGCPEGTRGFSGTRAYASPDALRGGPAVPAHDLFSLRKVINQVSTTSSGSTAIDEQ